MRKKLEILQQILPWTLLIIAAGFMCWQYRKIDGLQQIRQKRQLQHEIDEEATVLLPIFAQISKKHIRKVCMENFHSLKYYREKIREPSKNVKKELRRKCNADAKFGPPQLVGERKTREGCAYLDGVFWHICEMSHGYTMLTFKGLRQLNTSTTRAVQFLPYPFYGTDNTVYNNTMYYSEHSRLVAYNFKDESLQEISLHVSMEPLYFNSTSRMDIQADEHGIWVLYRRVGEKNLSVSRFNTRNMRISSNWTLPSVDTSELCNSFIRCAVLFSVTCNGNVMPVYDFYSHNYIQGREYQWKEIRKPIANVQYDPNSKSIAIFANSKIYKVTIN